MYTWDPEFDQLVHDEFVKSCKKRLPQIIYDAVNRPPKGRDLFIPDTMFTSLQEKRKTDEFMKKSKTQSANRRQFQEDGKLVATHHGGSLSTIGRVKKMVRYFNV